MADYGLESEVFAINKAAAEVAVRACRKMSAETPDRPRFAGGSLGPTNRTASLSPDVNDPGFRSVDFDDLEQAYYEQVCGLMAGGVDLLFPETTFDTLNLKAALHAIERYFVEHDVRVPVIASITITDASGRTLSGQTVEAAWNSIAHFDLLGVSVNCALGADEMRQHVEELAQVAPTLVGCYPNAGLPNELGGYDETPEQMAAILGEFAAAGLVNIVGGCCGTTPEHIRAIAEAVSKHAPRTLPDIEPRMRLSGLEPFVLTDDIPFIMVGERTNVTGSRRFARLIRTGDYDHRHRGRPQPGRGRRQHPRRQHGRGAARFGQGDDDLPEPDRRRARHRPGADHDRQLSLRGPRGRAALPAGEGRRQLDQPQGGRGDLPRPGPDDPPLRRRRRRDGLRRGGPGDPGCRKVANLSAGLPVTDR